MSTARLVVPLEQECSRSIEAAYLEGVDIDVLCHGFELPSGNVCCF
jgi:hypothetical protein